MVISKPKTKNRIAVYLGIIFIIAFGILVFPAKAQTYYFSLDKEIVNVYWEQDGTVSLFYELVFLNDTFADPIDFVDIGIPTTNYHIGNINALINGKPIRHIQDSYYVEGIELGLQENSIQPGNTGVVKVGIWGISNVLFVDSTDDNYASAKFSPNWFGSEYVYGTTDLTVIYHLPPGVLPEEPRYHKSPSGWPEQPLTGFDTDGRITYTWSNQFANGYTQYEFGASFPNSYVPISSISSPTILDYLNIEAEDLIGIVMIICFVGLFFGIPILSLIQSQRRKLKYLPPKVSISGHGIKRGLTAIEAAIILEEPMDKIFTMILFASIKKGAVKILKQKPLKLERIKPQPSKLRGYEINFISAMTAKTKAQKKKALENTMVKLVKSVSKSMKGFSRRETRRYYRDIIEKAWAQVESAKTPEVRGDNYDKVMEWTLLDKNYQDRTHRVFRSHSTIIPHWWHHYDPKFTSKSQSQPNLGARSSGTTSNIKLPGADFAASIVTGVQDMAAGVVGNVKDFTSGITKTTNPPPKPSSSSYSGGSGGSSCACACAGCACACAGGGR